MATRTGVFLVAVTAIVIAFGVGALVIKAEDSSAPPGSVYRIAPEAMSSFPQQPWCKAGAGFCIVQRASGDLAALYLSDVNPPFRDKGCAIKWQKDLEFLDPDTGAISAGWFRGDCSGSTFDREGHRVFGPAAHDMDEFALTVRRDPATQRPYIEVDTRGLICQQSEIPCQRAP